MVKTIGIVSAPDSRYAEDLCRAASRLTDVRLQRLQYAELQFAIPAAAGGSTGQAGMCDAYIIRSMPLGSLEQVIFRMDCLHALEQAGARIVNPPRALEIAIDKWLSLQRLHAAGIAVPPTVACQTRPAALEAWEELGGDVVVKPLFGGEGRGILRVDDADMAWRVFGTLQQLNQVIYVQQFVEHFGYDIRVLFVGDTHYAIRRTAGDGWKTNLTQGGTAERQALTGAQLDVARRAAAVVGGPGFDRGVPVSFIAGEASAARPPQSPGVSAVEAGCRVLGVDLLPARDGQLWVLEVNAVPGWQGVNRVYDVDIARELLADICQLI